MLDNWIDFRAKTLRKKEHCYTMIKWSIAQEDIVILNGYTLNKIVSKYKKMIIDKTKSQIHKYIWELQYPIEVLDRKKPAKR